MKYLSVCSGIEAASVAWHPLGWEPAAFCEIEAFPSAVLKERYPHVPNYGDFTRLSEPDHPIRSAGIDLLVGGTPCQAFSVAGLRKGLADPRGGLTLEFVRLAQALRPRWIVWENVPGVLSQDGGRAFGAFLGALGELGYGWAYRVLDAQYVRVDGYPHAVPQRRRRVFVVGCAGGDFARAASVLLEPEGVRRDPPTRRTKRKGAAADAAGGFAVCGTLSDGAHHGGGLNGQDAYTGRIIPVTYAKTHKQMSEHDAEGWTAQDHSPTITHWPRDRSDSGTDVAVVGPMAFDARQSDTIVYGDRTGPLDTDGHSIGVCVTGTSAHTLTTRSGVTEDGTGRGTPIVPALSFKPGQSEAAGGVFITEEYAPTLQAINNGSTAVPAVAFAQNQLGEVRVGSVTNTLNTNSNASGRNTPMVVQPMSVRRLTPRECERLQGFPDDYTAIPWKGKAASECPDGPRDKALGNSMAVNVMRWIGRRIEMVDAL